MKTEIREISEESLSLAREILGRSGVVAFPTETVYGLGAIATDDEAVREIYRVKGRPADNPLIAHVYPGYDLERLVKIGHRYVRDLLGRYTPGPLTMVFESRGVVSSVATCGGDTLAVRIPSHEGAQRFLRAVGSPIAAPSANVSKHVSPTTGRHVYEDLNGKIPLILDGGPCSGGIESTVLDVTGDIPRILRAGLVTQEMIASVAGDCEVAKHLAGDRVRSPGIKYKHYAPSCETVLFSEQELKQAQAYYDFCAAQGGTPYFLCAGTVAESLRGNKLILGFTPEEIAEHLYEKLREGEKCATCLIAVRLPDKGGIYDGISNRLNKACSRS